MNSEDLKRAAEVMLYKAEHPEAVVECKASGHINSQWMKCGSPIWNWENYDYRIREEPREYWVNEYNWGMGVLHKTVETAADLYDPCDSYIRTIHLREVKE